MFTDTHEIEYSEVRAFITQVLADCFTHRDYKKAAAHTDPYAMCIGLRASDVCMDRDSLEKALKRQMNFFPSAMEYAIIDQQFKDFGNHWWNYYGQIALRATRGNWGIVRYVIRLSAFLHKTDSQWKICGAHISEASGYDGISNKLNFTSHTLPAEERPPITQEEIGSILNQLLPGGILSRHYGEGYPLSFVNNQFLKMSGYQDLPDFTGANLGLFVNCLHPEDVDKFDYVANFIAKTGKQCECDYRIRRKDGTYLWVHDVARKAVSDDGAELIVSVVTDISHRVERIHTLEKESEIDYLTNIYNRKGAIERLENWETPFERCVLFLIDLDNFKNINDMYGHSVGDHVLRFTASILASSFGKQGIVSRLGGDEFSVFIPDYIDIKKIEQKLQQISSQFKEYIKNISPAADSSLSVGGVYGSGDMDVAQKYEQADANLYKVKNNRKDGILLTRFDA